MVEWLKTEEAAELAGVSGSTIKRWANDGLIGHRRTAGGHRRYRRADVLRMTGVEAEPWVDIVLESTALELEVVLLGARAEGATWIEIVTRLGSTLEQIGERWVAGELSVADEHRATAKLSRVLARLCDRFQFDPSPPAFLATPPGDPHTLGLSLVEVVLRDIGFPTEWVGANTPTDELVRIVRNEPMSLLALSASANSDAETLRAVVEAVAPAAEESGVPLVLGGRAPWPSEGGRRFAGWAQFQEWASALRSS